MFTTDTLKTTSPLLSKVFLAWLTEAYIYHRLPDEVKASGQVKQPLAIGYGIGLAFALFAMQG
jgi:ATP-binding cassette subfamily C (CFTR/MRP) protein 1